MVAWLNIVLIGRMSSRSRAARMSTRNTERPWLGFDAASSGVVRASRIIRSECSARDVQIFWPRIT